MWCGQAPQRDLGKQLALARVLAAVALNAKRVGTVTPVSGFVASHCRCEREGRAGAVLRVSANVTELQSYRANTEGGLITDVLHL